MKKNCKTGKRIISLLVTLAMCMSIMPVVLADAPTSEGWTVKAFGADDFHVYKHTAADSADASCITGKTIDLSDPLHFYYSISGISYDGFAMMRVDSANDKTVPTAGMTIADKGFYQLDGSTSSSSWYEYFRSSDAESVKNYNDDGSYTEATYDDGTTKYDHGMYLQYEAGNKTKYYIKPGYYRFVHFHREARTITYSDVYQITDKNGVYTEPGSADVSFTANGFDTPVNSLLSDDTFDMAITSLKGADGKDISLNSADVTNIEFLTNYLYIPINGSSLDSVVSYEYSYSYPMYNGSEVADGRTLVKTNDAITLKNCTAKWIVSGKNIASLLSDGEIYKYRVRVTAKVGGEEKVFMTDAPIKITAAYSVTTIITDSLNKGSIGVKYNAQLSGATPDKSELKWTVDSGELPPGLTLGQNGTISGTPTSVGTYKFKVKMTATGDGTSDTKEYTVVITKRQLVGYWWMNLTSESYYKGDITNYTVTAKPRISGGTPFEGTPVSGTTLNVSFDYGVLQNDSTVTVTKPASGVTASVGSYDITLTFDGSAEITADGIEFTINNAKNPNSSYIYSSVSSTSNSKNSRLETDTTDMDITNGYTHTPLTSADGINLTIADYESYKDMDMRLVVTRNGEETIYYLSGAVTGIDSLGIQKDDEYTVRLEAKDALWNWHTYYKSGTLTGDGNGNPLTITPNPAASDTLTGYTLTSTLDGVANRDIPTDIYKDGKQLGTNGGYYWLTSAEGITAKPGWSFSSSYPGYDSEGTVTVNGTQITVDYPKLAQTAQLTGTVKNTASEPVANAAVVANVSVNGTTVTYNTVTAKDGRYTLNNMYNGKNVTITAWADGYEEGSETVNVNGTATADITLSPTSSITVVMGDGQSVTKPEFTVYDSSDNIVTSRRFTSGSRFTLVLPSSASNAQGTAYKVNMTSEDTSGTATGTAAFGADKSASVSLTPERLGYIDWSGVDGTDFRVLLYKDGSYYKSFEAAEQQCVVPAGEYTVYLSKNYSKQDEDPSETVTVEAGKTVSLSIEPPKSEKFVVASANGPKTAEKGKYYEVSGVIESATDAQGRQFFGLDASMSGGVTVLGYKINGSYVGLSDDPNGRSGWAKVNKYYAPEYPYVDWSFPLSYTLYVRQNADFGDNQSVTMYACYGDSSNYYPTNVTTIGTVITKSALGITITCPEVLGAKTVKTDIGDTEKDTLVPNDLDFSGTAPSNAYVKIYDNDTLIAIAKAEANGNYSGRASLASSYRSHTLRAEADADLGGEDTVISAEKSFTYSPTGPVLTGLWLNGSKLSITGGMTAYNPNTLSLKNNGYTYEASFENDDRLADITVDDISSEPTEGGERAQITGKVFFIVSTSTGSYTLKAEKKQSGLWTATSMLGGSDPLDVKVMYEEKDDLTAPKVTITDVTNNNEQVEITPDNAYAVKLKDGETVDWSDKAGLLEALGISEGDEVTDDTDVLDPNYTWVPDETDYDTASFDSDNAEKVSGLDDYFTLMSSAKSTSDLMNSLAAQLQNSGVVDDPNDESLKNADGIKAVDALTTSQAYARSGNYYEERTWIDSPTWTREGVKWRIEELTANGYKPNYLTDSSSGREYIYFEQTLYYSHYGDPVDALYKRASDNGVPKNVVSPLMFDKGKAIGSTLRVKYVYDVKAGKWMRMQTAIMPPDTTSPIHTSPNQIPNKTERPYRYVPVSDLNLTSTGDFSLMASGQRTGGMSVKIRLDRVSEKTYGSAVCSVGSFATAKFLQTQKVHKFVDVDNAKWGKYSLSFEESAGGLFWTGVGSNVPDEGQSSIVPTERDAGVGSLDALRKSLESNYRYYARLDKEGGVHRATAQYGKERTKKLLNELADLEYAIEMAGVQDAFTKSVSDQLSGASAFVGMFGGTVGAGGALVMDTVNVLINAANDTNNSEVMEAAEKFKSKVDRYMSYDKADKERMKKDEQEKKDYNNSTGFPIYGVEDEVFDDPFDGGSSKPTAPTAQTVPVHDPSGVVYEGVIENPVEGATVTLYKYDAESGVPVQHDDSIYLNQQNPLTTDENGHYNWDVPEGEWYVTASKDGYTPGNSGADTAAKVTHTVGGETMSFLPVLPPQLDVNIPLVDKTAPEVTDVTYTPQGIYVTFSKYMVDTGYNDNGSVLESNNYTLTGEDGPITNFYAESIVQGHVPSNIDINKRTYTKTVRLVPAWGTEFEGDISLTVSGSVRSYADTALGEVYYESGTAESGELDLTVTKTTSGAVIKNNSLFTDKAAIIVADYDKDGALVNVLSEEYEFDALGEKSVTFTNTLTHRVFVWNSLDGMKPIGNNYN